MISACQNPETKQFVIAAIVTRGSNKRYTPGTNAIKPANTNIDIFTTSASRNLQKLTVATKKLTLEAHSATVLTGIIDNNAG
jgi:hypothetical protein